VNSSVINITVIDRGYQFEQVHIITGEPIKLEFLRKDKSACAGTVLFQEPTIHELRLFSVLNVQAILFSMERMIVIEFVDGYLKYKEIATAYFTKY
tara:strand:- start:588 stop:875 length:288 start_codon:yes stop_codon:yes gene_type:complete